MQTNQFVSYSGSDENGNFEHQGVIKKITANGIVTLQTSFGEVKASVESGEWTKVAKPKGWAPATVTGLTGIKKAASTTQPTRVRRIGNKASRPAGARSISKVQKAEKIYTDMMSGNEHPQRKDLVTAFQKKLKLSAAGASTYATMMRHKFDQIETNVA